jgi:hypothetical protein
LVLSLFLAISFVPGARAATPTASAGPAAPTRLFLVLDNSWSMTKDRRLERAALAIRRWTSRLPAPAALSVVLATASERVESVGSFAWQSDADRAALLTALEGVQAVRATKTLFRAADRGITELVLQHTQPSEQVALLFLTDGVSDEPAEDLPAAALGSRVLSLGRGLIAVALGDVPSLAHLTIPASASRERPRPSPPVRATGPSQLRALLGGTLTLEVLTEVTGTPAIGFLGGREPVRVPVRVGLRSSVPRLVRFEALVSAGLTAAFSPDSLVVPPGQVGEIALALIASAPVDEVVTIIARLPGTQSESRTLRVRISPHSYLASNRWLVGPGAVVFVLATLLLRSFGQRAFRIGRYEEEGQAANLAVGDAVALSRFDPEMLHGRLVRSWRGLRLVADGGDILVGGRLVPRGKTGRYRLGEEIQVNGRSLSLYEIVEPPGPALAFEFGAPGGHNGELR